MLILHGHPLSTFHMKAAMALYETGAPFELALLDLGDEGARNRFYAFWPLGKFPVLRDEARGETVPETAIILDYLASFYAGETPLIPRDPDIAWKVRLAERIYDLHVQTQMQKIIDNRLRPPEAEDAFGVEQARGHLRRTLDFLDAGQGERSWAVGEAFSGADCAAAPALYYADKVMPFEASHPALWAYFQRLKARPSFARVLQDAGPYLHMFPTE